MKKLQKEQVLLLHYLLCEKTGGDCGVREEGLLDSALGAPFQTFAGEELYPTLEEKAARLGFSLIANHAFVDGNKRIGVLVALTFLAINGVSLLPTSDEVIRMGLGIASGEMDYQGLLAWIRKHRNN